ncbi:MAG: DUF262 domain-containing protein [Bacteroidetes bacterium]|nr:DUF262 domain-containing protein [Bacteroidota bacterium]
MSKNIAGAEYPLAKIFSSDFDYTIPSYQRPYAWTEDEAGELFDDLYDFYQNEQEEGYFLGSIVLIKEEGRPEAEVIDGQQRLTTLTILLAALTSLFSGDLRYDFDSYVRERGSASQGLRPKPRLSLRERDRAFFASNVQSLEFVKLLEIDPVTLANEAQRNIQSNSRLLLRRLEEVFSGNEIELCKFGAFLVQRCFLVAVSTPSQKSAFRVFSVMNSRGLDLLPIDIVKADVIGKIQEEDQDAYTDRWEVMEIQTGRAGFNDLFGHIRMVYTREKAKKSLLEEFRASVMSQVDSSEKLIEEILEPYSAAYQAVKTAQYESSSTADGHKANELLKWLNRIDNSDWIPPAMLLLSQLKGSSEYALWFLTKLERLAACMHLCAKNVNYRIERYAEVIAALQNVSDLRTAPDAIELTDAEKREMQTALDGKIYWMTPRRRNYLILRLDSFLADGAATYDPTVLTIEHVLPQTVTAKSPWAKPWPDKDERWEWVHRLANLVPLAKRKNSSAQDFDFERKKKVYFAGRDGVSSYALTTQVLAAPEWTPQVIRNRQQQLLDVLVDKWKLAVT